MEALLTIIVKVAVMLIMIAVGCVITKRGLLTEKGASELTAILLKIVTPCLIIVSFLDSEGGLGAGEMLLAAGLAGASMVIGIAVSLLFFRREPEDRKKVLRFSVIFSNAGFMGMPLVQAIVGGRGVIYGSFFIAMFNLVCWTYGYRMMNGEGKLSLKNALLNPGIIGLAVGIPLYFLKVPVPQILGEPVRFFSNLNTPLAMLVIGSYVARVSPKSFVSDGKVYALAALRLLAAPALFFLLLLLIRPNREMFMSCAVQAACPTAANVLLFSVQYGGDARLASKTVAVTTVLSILTIPLFTVLAQLAA